MVCIKQELAHHNKFMIKQFMKYLLHLTVGNYVAKYSYQLLITYS